MKISNNALNFLLAQYRAIFKRAYVKGIASAVLLTAGLAMGQAQADTVKLDSTDDLPDVGQTATITGTDATGIYNNSGKAEFSNIALTSGSGDVWNGDIIIESGTAGIQDGNNYITSNADLKISGDGSLTIDIQDKTGYKTQGLTIAGYGTNGGNATTLELNIGKIDVQNGTLNITDSGSSSNSGTVLVAADDITIGSSTKELTAYVTLASSVADKGVTLGRATTLNEAGSDIVVNNGGKLIMQGSGSSGATIQGASLTLGEGAVMLTDTGVNNWVETDDFKVQNGAFKVITPTATDPVSETFLGKTGTVQAGGNVLVGTSGTWVIGQGADPDVATDPLGTAVTFESGANVQLSGTLSVSGGKLTVADGANLYATVANNGSNNDAGTIKVSSSSDPASSGALVIGVETLQNFLKGGQEYTAIVEDTENEGKYKLDTDAETKPESASGSVLVTNGILQLVSDKQINLADTEQFSFSGGTTASAGKIVISGSTIIADDVLVSQKITDLDASDAVSLEVNDLTLGDKTVNAGKVSDLGFNQATTHNLTVLTSTGSFGLANNVVLHATNRDVTLDGNIVEVAENGTITGNLEVWGSSKLTVDAGHYTTNDDLTISDATLEIHGTSQDQAEDGTYYPNGLDASLTIGNGGNFVIDHASAKVNITGNAGAEAFLDLRKANSVKWGSGSITVSGTLGAVCSDPNVDQVGQGTLYITGAQFEQYLDTETGTGHAASTSEIDLKNNGVLFVDGSTTSLEYDVSDFATTADSGTVAFTGAGTFETDTALTLEIASGASDQFLAIGTGTIKAPTIRLENNEEDATEFVVSGGTLEVASGLTSNVGMVSFDANGGNGSSLNLDGQGSVGVDVTFSGTGSALNVQSGRWTAQNAFFEASSALNIEDGASLELDNINVTGTGVSGDVGVGSSLTVDTIQTAADTAFTIADKSVMTINGRSDIVETGDNADIDAVVDNADTAGINITDTTFTVTGPEAQLKIGSTAVSKLVTFENQTVQGEQVRVLTVDDALKAKYELNGYATLYLDFAQGVSLTAANARELKEQLFTGGEVGQGIINVGSGSLAIEWEPNQDKVVKWDNVKDFAEIESVTSNELMQALVTEVTGTVAGHYGAMQVDADKALSVDGNLGLHAARGDYFVFSQSGEAKTAEDVVIQGGSLLLGGAGKIGAINAGGNDVTIAPSTLEGAVAGTTEVLGAITNAGTLDISNETTVAGDVSANTLELADDTSLTNSTYSMTLGSVDLDAGSTLSTTNLTLNGDGAIWKGAGQSWIEGSVDVASKLTVSAGNVTIANGTVSAQATELASGVIFQVGQDAVADQDDPATTDINEAESFSGTFETTTLALNGATFIVDPEYGLPTALASVRNFADASDAEFTDESKVGTADGSIFVGQNSVLGIGTESADELAQIIAKYQTNGSLSGAKDRLGSIVYLDGIATIAAGQGMVMTNKSVADFVTYYNDADGVANQAISEADPTSAFGNTVFFGDGTALMATAEAIKAAHDHDLSLVTFAGQNGKLVADGGEVLISGDLRGNTAYTLFADKGGAGDDNDTKVDVVDIEGNVAEAGHGITVTTENGFLVGEINNDNGGVVTLGLAADARARMSGASDPVYNTLVAYFNGYNGVKTTNPDTGADTTDYLYKELVSHPDPATGEVTYTKDYNYHGLWR